MKYKDAVRILRLIDQAAGADIELDTGDLRISLTRGGGLGDRPTPEAEAAPPSAAQAPAVSVQGTGSNKADTGVGTAVAAPMGGMFYASPAPGQPAFATEGQEVQAGDQLGIIEVMKLFTPITAPVSGTLSLIIVEDQQTVAKDEVLMRIEEA